MLNDLKQFATGTFQVIVHNNTIKPLSIPQFKGGLTDAGFYHLWRVCATLLQAMTQLLNRRGLNKDGEGLFTILFLDVTATQNIDIKNHVLTRLELTLYLRTQGTVEASWIDLLVLQEFSTSNSFSKFLCRKKVVLHPMLLRPARRTTSGRDREMKIQRMLHQTMDKR